MNFSKISDSAGLEAQAGHDDDRAAADHRDGVHPLQHRQGRLQPLRGLPGERRKNSAAKLVLILVCFNLNFNKTHRQNYLEPNFINVKRLQLSPKLQKEQLYELFVIPQSKAIVIEKSKSVTVPFCFIGSLL